MSSVLHGFKLTFTKTVERQVQYDESNSRQPVRDFRNADDGRITGLRVERSGDSPAVGTYTLEMAGLRKISLTDADLPFTTNQINVRYGPDRAPLRIQQSWSP